MGRGLYVSGFPHRPDADYGLAIHLPTSLIGSPDDIAAGFASVCAAGFTGIAVNLVNFSDDFPLFRDEVLPGLERRGIRLPHVAAPSV